MDSPMATRFGLNVLGVVAESSLSVRVIPLRGFEMRFLRRFLARPARVCPSSGQEHSGIDQTEGHSEAVSQSTASRQDTRSGPASPRRSARTEINPQQKSH
jgi:hypothetical protein